MINPSSKMHRISLVFFAFFLSLPFARAEISLGELNLVARRWGVDQGKNGLDASSIAQTSDGSIWVGNHNGVYRFKGQQVTHHETASMPALGNRHIQRMCVDPKDTLWLNTRNNDIASFRDDTFTRAKLPSKAGNLICWCPHAVEGVVACYGGKDGMRVYWITLNDPVQLLEGQGITPRNIHMEPNGQIWIAMRDGTMSGLKDGVLTKSPTTEIRKIGGFITRRDGSVLAIGSEASYLLEQGRWKEHLRFSTPIKSRNPATNGIEDQDGRLWLSVDRAGLWICHQDGTLDKIANGRHSIPGTIGQLFTDQDENIWAATFSGLYQIRYAPFVTRKVPVGITAPEVVSIKIDSDGVTWFTCFGGICRVLPGQEETELVIPRPIVEVTQLAVRNFNSIWYGNKDQDFFHWDGTKSIRVALPKIRSAFVPTGMEVDHDGIAWLTAYAGVFRCDPNKSPLVFEKISGTRGLPNIPYQNIRLNHEGTIYLASRGKGIFYQQKEATDWTPLNESGADIFTRVGPIDPDPEGRVWIVTPNFPFDSGARGSIGCMSQDEKSSIPFVDLGIRVNLISSFALDHQDGIWLQSIDQGLIRLKKSEVYKRLYDPSFSPSVTRFGLPDGLPSLEGTFTTRGIQCHPNGQIWVATHEGLSTISPERWLREKERSSTSELILNQLHLDNKPVPLSRSGFSVPPEAHTIGISYDSVSYGFPAELNFKHRLLGSSDDWQEVGNLREVTYQKLPPGDYQFEVMSTDRFGNWSDNTITFPIKVHPYWWERKSVQVAFLILIAALVFVLVQLRLRSMRRKNALQENFSRQLISSQEQERKRIAGELHDSLGQSLLVVKNLAALGERQDPPSPDLYPEIADSVSEALEQVRTISRDLRPPELDHLGITKAITATIARVENSSSINFTSHVDEIGDLLTPDQEICLYRILQESLNNIIKHASARQTTILVTKKSRSVDLMIEDDGCGFTPDKPESSGIGLTNMRDRALLAGGTFTIESTPGKGTRSHLALPLRDSPPSNTQ